MEADLEAIFLALAHRALGEGPIEAFATMDSALDADRHVEVSSETRSKLAESLNSAFLVALAGRRHPGSEEARRHLERLAASGPRDIAGIAGFYREGLVRIEGELEEARRLDQDFSDRVGSLAELLSGTEAAGDPGSSSESSDAAEDETFWSVFFPEARDIRGRREARLESLRAKRAVTVTRWPARTITDPAQQLLFTANVLLTIPPSSEAIRQLPIDEDIKKILEESMGDAQQYWYDHPMPIGVEPEHNEMLHGLHGLDAALEFERAAGNLAAGAKCTCILSVSTTHPGLHGAARSYLEGELARSMAFDKIDKLLNLEVLAFSEADVRLLVEEVLAPAAGRYLQCDDPAGALEVLGVDGEYGRHYSFLKAIAALWQVLVNPEGLATFKIDLDQVFPQRELVEQTGSTAFEHFGTPFWGAEGVDAEGRAVELGMLAGSLVNERDIGRSLFVPDVLFPERRPRPDELVFFSALPQALSTEAEMSAPIAGTGRETERNAATRCYQRIHVTGGTTGIRIDSLRRHRPFTPSFIGRAEDQAYILSVLHRPGPRLAYLHAAGLRMRHDKEAFAAEAIKAAEIGKLVGDYVRILHLSAYARTIVGGIARIKELLDPFTGCFISAIPETVVHLRFALKAAAFFEEGDDALGCEFVSNGAARIGAALGFVEGRSSQLARRFELERRGWDLYYDCLDALEKALLSGDDFALAAREKARYIFARCRLRNGSEEPLADEPSEDVSPADQSETGSTARDRPRTSKEAIE